MNGKLSSGYQRTDGKTKYLEKKMMTLFYMMTIQLLKLKT